MSAGDKGNFKTDLPQDVLDAALEAVRKRQTPATEIEVDVQPGAGNVEAAPGVSGAADSKEIEQLTAQLDASLAKGREMMDRIKDEHEKVLRATADLENYKKRAAKEREEMQKFGIEKLLKDFVPVLDNIDRALDPANSGELPALRQGVEMIRKLLEDTLAKHGVRPFNAKGKPFDPNVHEAMGQLETNEMPPNHVANEILRGFMLNDRLVRPALVMVSKAKSEPAAPDADPKGALKWVRSSESTWARRTRASR